MTKYWTNSLAIWSHWKRRLPISYSVHEGKHFLFQLWVDYYFLSWFTTEPVGLFIWSHWKRRLPIGYSVHEGKHFLFQLWVDYYFLSWFTTEPVVHLLLLKFSMPHWISAADIATNLLIFGKYLASPSFYIHKIFPSRNLLLQLRVRRFGASERT